MTQSAQGLIRVIEHEIITLRGLRLSPDLDVATAAVKRQQARERELADLRATVANDDDEEEPLPMAASQQPGGAR